MTELEQLRAQLIELAAENSRLREAMNKCKNRSGPRCQWCDEREHTKWCPDTIIEEALSDPTPTGFGSQVLALARAGASVALTYSMVPGEIARFAQPFIENPELRKLLGVE